MKIGVSEGNYGIEIMKVQNLWKNSIFGEGVVVGVIDSGCYIDHSELKDNIIDRYNFTSDDDGDINNVTDYSGHGTHIAGIIAAKNKQSIIGVAPKAKMVILKVIDKNNMGSYEALIKAINFATKWRGQNNERINVLNLSLGGQNNDSTLRATINRALANDINIVVAAGNYGDGDEETNEILYPGFYKEVIQVAAVDQNLTPTTFSNTNVNIDFLAPGKNIYSTFLNNKYQYLSGTSMAAPQITGVIALLNEYFRKKNILVTQKNIYNYLVSNANFLKGYTLKTQGKGLIQLEVM